MNTRYAFENRLREPAEFSSGLVYAASSFLCAAYPALFFLTPALSTGLSLGLAAMAARRFYQGYKLRQYQKGLLELPTFTLSTNQVPLSKEHLYVGLGFRWQALHRQRLHLLSLVQNQHFLQKSWLYQWVQRQAAEHPNGFAAYLQATAYLPFQKAPDIGGKPWLHGVGSDEENKLYLKQANRNGHMVVFGMTRVGKTRLMSIIVNQDIRNGEAVLVLDPKGDTDLVRDMYAACKAAGRLADFKILHAGFAPLSAKYNPLASYSNISEVATRVAGAIQADGEGKTFQDFAWKFLNVTATCLQEMGETVSYRTLAFFVMRPKQLLLAYCDKVLPNKYPDYNLQIEKIIEQSKEGKDNKGRPKEPLNRSDAIRQYVAALIETQISSGGHAALQTSIIADLHHAAQTSDEYYGKITASLGPVFDKINKTAAGDIFSWNSEEPQILPVLNLEEVISQRQVAYIGLDAMSNRAMSEAVGQAVIADLISVCGRLYKAGSAVKTLCLHADEFAEIVRDEFITLLNKAGGAGVKVTAYTQTYNDLGAVFGSNPHKPKMLLGNFGTVAMLRVANLDTARIFTECLELTRARSSLPSTGTSDQAHGREGELFSTQNTDSLVEDKTPLITENDVFSLPKGQAFVLTNGGELYKTRLPLPANEEDKNLNIEDLMRRVNGAPVTTQIGPELEPESVIETTTPVESKDIKSQEQICLKEPVDANPNPNPNPNPIPTFEQATQLIKAFKIWLTEKIDSGDPAYEVNKGKSVFVSALNYRGRIFITQAVLEAYQKDSAITPAQVQQALRLIGPTYHQSYTATQGPETFRVLCIREFETRVHSFEPVFITMN